MSVREEHNLTIRRDTKGGIPNLPFVAVRDAILGKSYELSVLFPSQSASIELHKQWKQKPDPVNVLAFPLDDREGEIVITLAKARTEASSFGHSYLQHVLFLFIHACLHLKGYEHGDTMERREAQYLKKFGSELIS